MKQIIVIGSGPSGLAATYQLRKAGHSVRVLEANDHIGGRVQTESRDECLLDTGASLIPGRYAEFIAMCDELGIKDNLVPSGSIVGFSRSGEIHYLDSRRMFIDGTKSKLFSLASKLRFLRIGIDALRIFPALQFDSIHRAGKYDNETAADYAARALNDEMSEFFVGNTIRSMFGNTLKEASVVDFFWGVRNFLGGALLGLRGGNKVFIDALAKDIDIQTGVRVTEISETSDQVIIDCVDTSGKAQQLTTDGCICATDANTAALINRSLPEDVSTVLREYPYCASLSVHFVLSKRPEEKAFVLEFPISEETDMTPLVYEHNKVTDRAPADKGLLCALYGHHYSESHFQDSDETLIANTLKAVRKYVPEIDATLLSSHVTRWERSVVKSEPGTYRKLAPLIEYRNSAKRVHLAGDYFSISGMNSAIVSGRIAAENIDKYLA